MQVPGGKGLFLLHSVPQQELSSLPVSLTHPTSGPSCCFGFWRYGSAALVYYLNTGAETSSN
jgi:hypothetical protein